MLQSDAMAIGVALSMQGIETYLEQLLDGRQRSSTSRNQNATIANEAPESGLPDHALQLALTGLQSFQSNPGRESAEQLLHDAIKQVPTDFLKQLEFIITAVPRDDLLSSLAETERDILRAAYRISARPEVKGIIEAFHQRWSAGSGQLIGLCLAVGTAHEAIQAITLDGAKSHSKNG
jgi:hypothetical protein